MPFWLNEPSTVSKINADNLSRTEKFLVATAGANGDYYVTVPNGANVASGDVVKIKFPVATNSASDARLSLNGGSTYKNIRNGINIPAYRIQYEVFTMYYDGTYFIPLELTMRNDVFAVTVSAGTANKGTFPGRLQYGDVITLILTNGNTAVSPTIVIGDTTYTITDMPTVAKLSTSANQVYKLRKVLADTLEFVVHPDYVTEYGTNGDYKYERRANGFAKCYMVASFSSGTLTMTQVSTSGIYASNEVNVALPTGLFNNTGYCATPNIFSSSYVVSINPIYSSAGTTSNQVAVVILKGGSSTSAVSFRMVVEGTWK